MTTVVQQEYQVDEAGMPRFAHIRCSWEGSDKELHAICGHPLFGIPAPGSQNHCPVCEDLFAEQKTVRFFPLCKEHLDG